MSAQAAETLRALLSSRSGRIRFEAARAILLWSWGAPKQSVTLGGGFGDLSAELARALAEARQRRAGLEAAQVTQACAQLAQGVVEGSAEPASALKVEATRGEETSATRPDVVPALPAGVLAAGLKGGDPRLVKPRVSVPGAASDPEDGAGS